MEIFRKISFVFAIVLQGLAHEASQKAFHQAIDANVPLIVVDNTNTQEFELRGYIETAQMATVFPILVEEGIPVYTKESMPLNVVTLEFVVPNETCVVHCFSRCRHSVPLNKMMRMWLRWENCTINPVYIRPNGMPGNIWSLPCGTDPLYFTHTLAVEAAKTSHAKTTREEITELKKKLITDIRSATNLIPIEKPLYAGLILDKTSVSRLLATVPPRFEEIRGDHMTISYKPHKSLLGRLPVGKHVSLRCLCEVVGSDVQVVHVRSEESPRPWKFWSEFNNQLTTNEVPHITVSTRTGTKAKFSNQLLEQWKKEGAACGIQCSDRWQCRYLDDELPVTGFVGITLVREIPYTKKSQRRVLTSPKAYYEFCKSHGIMIDKKQEESPDETQGKSSQYSKYHQSSKDKDNTDLGGKAKTIKGKYSGRDSNEKSVEGLCSLKRGHSNKKPSTNKQQHINTATVSHSGKASKGYTIGHVNKRYYNDSQRSAHRCKDPDGSRRDSFSSSEKRQSHFRNRKTKRAKSPSD